MMNYEEAVQALQADPEKAGTVETAYLDANFEVAANRFQSSDEFFAIKQILFGGIVPRGASLLDFGCGNGIASCAFSNSGMQVFSLDPDLSPKVGLGVLHDFTRDKDVSFRGICAIAEQLPFAANSFDYVYERQALHHLGALQVGLNECARVLKSGGYFLATREHVVDDDKQLQEFLDNHPLHKLHGRENAYRLDQYQACLRNAGFEIVRSIAPFESVLNHFPISNAEVRFWLKSGLQRRLGNTLGNLVSRVELVEGLYRWQLSRRCTYPGRLWSFLCKKSD